jgi:hypothetical protein
MQLIRAVSGTRPAPPLEELVPRIAPRPALLIASGHGAEVKATEPTATRRARALNCG